MKRIRRGERRSQKHRENLGSTILGCLVLLGVDEDSSHSRKGWHFRILYEGFNSNTSFLVQGALLFLQAYVRSYGHHTDTEEDIATVRKMVAGISVSD